MKKGNTESSPLPGSGGQVLDRAGIKNSGYIVKKSGIPDPHASTGFNVLPPGMEIEDQPNADIRAMPYKEVTGKSYPGDGWN